MASFKGILNFIATNIQFGFNVANREAIKYFESKGLRPTFSYLEMQRDEHNKALTVAKMMDMDMLQDVHDSLTHALKKGWTYEEWSDRIIPILQANGWWGRQEVTDPVTGKTIIKELGSPHRLKTIFRTNMQQAYMVGRWQQIMQTAKERPYLRYDAIDDSRTRPKHRKWDGTILPFNHKWWRTHYPPCGYNCRCSITQFSKADLEAYGLEVTENPDLSTDGIDTGFDYNAGLDHWNHLQDIASQKAQNIKDEALRKAAQEALLKSLDDLPKVKNVDNKQFKQPPSETFSIYDSGAPIVKPDVSTPLKKAVVKFENEIRAKDVEHGAFFGFDEKSLILSGKGDASKLAFAFTANDLEEVKNSVFTHNHPNGGTFSLEDIIAACDLQLSEIRAVTNTFRFRMEFSKNWVDEEILQKVIDEVIPRANDIVTDMLKRDELHISNANDEVNHQIWRLVAQRLKFTYIRERS